MFVTFLHLKVDTIVGIPVYYNIFFALTGVHLTKKEKIKHTTTANVRKEKFRIFDNV